MADLTVTAAEVLSTNATTQLLTAGATITAGQPVYQDSTDSDEAKTCVSSSLAAADCVGIALHGASDGQPLLVATKGTITVAASGTPVTIGETYYVSGTAGGLQPAADVASTEYVTIVGVGKTATTFELNIFASEVQRA